MLQLFEFHPPNDAPNGLPEEDLMVEEGEFLRIPKDMNLIVTERHK